MIFNKIMEESCPDLKVNMPIKVVEAYKTPNKLNQEGNAKRSGLLGLRNNWRVVSKHTVDMFKIVKKSF